MCGIVGIVNLDGREQDNTQCIEAMAATLYHRGPDDSGFEIVGAVSLGFRRLSIIDLQTGHQPLADSDKSIWIVFNGEIYNYIEIKKSLEKMGCQFRTQSDTEVIVYAYKIYGLDFVNHLRGMFAIAIWDRPAQQFLLVRDRLGQKPLFYSIDGFQLVFASEIKALIKGYGLREKQISPSALHDYLSFLYVPTPESILDSVQKLPPAHMLVANIGKKEWHIKRYWQVDPTPDRSISFEQYVDQLREELMKAVRIRLRSDVPLGAFLSGGVDSTIIVGLMNELASSVKTFSIAFPDSRFDESPYSRKTSSHFDVTHKVEMVDAASLQPEQLEELVWFMDEPFADSSFIPTYWVSKTARKDVTVALSGDGGDELFAGYTRYQHFRYTEQLSRMPHYFRLLGLSGVDFLFSATSNHFPDTSERLRLVKKAIQLSDMPYEQRLFAMLTYFEEEGKLNLYSEPWKSRLGNYHSGILFQRQLAQLNLTGESLPDFMARDLTTNLPDDALVKVDRASMACSLEVRSPFLDHRVVELALKIPPEFKIKGKIQKHILKYTFRELLPEWVLNHPKQGFEVPFAHWFQQKRWRDFLIDILSYDAVKAQSIFDPQAVVTLRDTFLSDPEANYVPLSAYQLRHRLWILLMFQLWYRTYIE